MTRGRRLESAVILVPLAATAVLAARFHYDFPYYDEWSIVPLVDRFLSGALSFRGDVFSQYLEHRIVIPRLIILGIAATTGWNHGVEVAVNILAAVAIFVLIKAGLQRTAESAGIDRPRSIIALSGLLVLSPSQWEIWIFGLNIHHVLGILLATGGVFLLCRSRLRAWHFASAVGLGVAAMFTFNTGSCYWLTGLVPLIWLHRSRPVLLGAWIVAGGLTMAVHFSDYSPSATLGSSSVAGLVVPFLAFVGSPIIARAAPAAAIGLFGLFVAFFTLHRLRGQFPLRPIAPFLVLGCYSLGTGAMAAIGRAGTVPGLDFASSLQALADNPLAPCPSRYIGYANLFWVPIFVLAAHARTHAAGERTRPILRAGLIAVYALAGLNAIDGFTHARDQHLEILPGRSALLTPDLSSVEDAVLETIGPDPDAVRFHAAILRNRRLSLYRGWTAGPSDSDPVAPQVQIIGHSCCSGADSVIHLDVTPPRLGGRLRVSIRTSTPGVRGRLHVDQYHAGAATRLPDLPAALLCLSQGTRSPVLAEFTTGEDCRWNLDVDLASDPAYLREEFVVQAVVHHPFVGVSDALRIRLGR